MASKGAPPFILKIKGNKTFSPFSTNAIGDEQTLWALHSVCRKVQTHLEEGRLENLSWRLWYLHTAVVSSKKDRDEFKKVSRGIADNLNKDKGKGVRELSAPELARSNSGRLASRVAEKSRSRRASREGGEKPTMASMMSSFDSTSTKRRDSMPTGGKKPTNIENSSRPSSPGPRSKSATSRTMDEDTNRGRGPVPTDFLVISPALLTTQSASKQSAWISSPSSVLSPFNHHLHQRASSSASFSQSPFPQGAPSYNPLISKKTSVSTSNSHLPPETHISLSIDDIFDLANSSDPSPPIPPYPNPAYNRNEYQPSPDVDPSSNDLPLEEILRGFGVGEGESSQTAGLDLGFNPWPADFGSLDFGGAGEHPQGVQHNGISFDELFASTMAGIESSVLQSDAILRPNLPGAHGSSYTTPSSVFSSSASPEEQRYQTTLGFGESSTLQHDRVRRLSKAQEPFAAREEFRRGSGGSAGIFGGNDGDGGVVEEMMLPPSLGQASTQHLRSVPTRRISTSSQISPPRKPKSRVSSFSSSHPLYSITNSSLPSSTSIASEHPPKRRRGSELSSEYSVSSILITAPWSNPALSPTSILLPPSTVVSPWNSAGTTSSSELAAGLQTMGFGTPDVAGTFMGDQAQSQTLNGDLSSRDGRPGGGGPGRTASGSSSTTAKALKSGQQQPSSSHPYQSPSSSATNFLRNKQRTSSTSSLSSQPFASGSSIPLTPYQLGFLNGFAPVISSSSSPAPVPSPGPGPVRRASESQSARQSSAVRAAMQEQQRQQQANQEQHRFASQSIPVSPNRRPVGLPGGGSFGGGAGGATRPLRLTLQEQLELAGMVPKTSSETS